MTDAETIREAKTRGMRMCYNETARGVFQHPGPSLTSNMEPTHDQGYRVCST
jgi:hypothetical protein